MLTAPLASNFNFNFLTTHNLTVDFNIPVGPTQVFDPLTNTDLTLEKVTTDANVPASSILLNNPSGLHATFSFTNISGSTRPEILTDGNYRASISKQAVRAGTAEAPEEMAADAYADFFVLAADGNGDRHVNLLDFNILAGNFNTTGKTFAQGNYDFDQAGNVNLNDFNVMAGRFNTSMPEPPDGPDEITVTVPPDFTFETAWLAKNVVGEQGWRVQYSLSGQFDEGTYTNLPADTSSWTTQAYPDGTRVFFRSRAYGNEQDTPYTPKRYGITPLPEPTINSATPLSSTQIKILFTDNSQNETHFQVYRATNMAGPYSPVGSPIPSGAPTQFTDSGLTPGTTYYYYVRRGTP